MIKCKILLFLTTIALVLSLTSSLRAEIDRDSIREEIHLMIEQADSLSEAALYDSAIVIGKQALANAETEFGIEDTTVALALHRLGAYYNEKGEYDKAELLWNRALIIRREILGAVHPDIAAGLNNLAALSHVRGNYAEAESLYGQALAIWEKTIGPEHPDVGKGLYNLGLIKKTLGKYAKAEPLFKRAIAIWSEAVGPEHQLVARGVSSLADLCMEQGNYAEAESLFRQAWTIAEKALGPGHPYVAIILRNLGLLYNRQGRYAEAEPLFKRSLAINEKVLGPEHPSVAGSMNNLAVLYSNQGKYAEAEALHNRALTIWERTFGSEHPNIANDLQSLANLYHDQRKNAEAELLFKRALAIYEKFLGREHTAVATNLNNLANLYHDQGKYAEAEPLFKRALAIREKVFGPEHTDVASSLNSLAALYHERALAIREKALDEKHPSVAFNLGNLADFYASEGDMEKSLKHYKKMMKSKQSFIDYAFSYASEELKMSYIQKYPLVVHSFFSFALSNESTETKRSTLEMALKGKAIIIDAVSAERQIAYCSYDDEIRARIDRYTNICGEMATLALAGSENLKPEIYRERMQTLNDIKDSLETELSRGCAEFKDELASRRFNVDDVASALPEGGVLLEYVWYEPYNFKKIGSDEEKSGPPRYLAFTLDHAGEITLTDLGDATEIDSLINLSRKIIYNAGAEVHTVGDLIAESNLSKVTGKLYDLIFALLESSLGGKTRIFISPDGQLSLLPFEIFPDGRGKYVIEKYNISYLSSGRDLLKFKKKPEYSNWALAMANPDFDLSRATLTERRDQALRKSEYTAFAYEPSRGASGCLNTRFDLLPYTKKETKSVVKTLKKKAKFDVDAYYGDKALEEVLKGMTIPPRVLHLSTHGYFCEDINITENRILENPLLRSGLAFAGANGLMDKTKKDISQVEDGILTAFEVSGLNLVGTELVTLSACETGVGKVRNGEGVYGLRRAFQQAGVRTILMSLWKVPDKETNDLMDNFYKNWAGGQAKQEAFRQSALKVIEDRRKKHGAAHPYYWGAFVMLGDPE